MVHDNAAGPTPASNLSGQNKSPLGQNVTLCFGSGYTDSNPLEKTQSIGELIRALKQAADSPPIDCSSQSPDEAKGTVGYLLPGKLGELPSPDSGNLRWKGNVLSISAYHIDIEGKSATEVESLFRHLESLNVVFCAWTTWKNSPADPRWRVLVFFEKEIDLDVSDKERSDWSERWWPVLNENLALGLNDAQTRHANALGNLPACPIGGNAPLQNSVQWKQSQPEAELFDPFSLKLPPKLELIQQTQAPQRKRHVELTKRVELAIERLERKPPAIDGEGGHNHTMGIVRDVVTGYDLDRESAFIVLQDWNDRCQPPWSDKELYHKIDEVLRTPDRQGRSLGFNLPAEKSLLQKVRESSAKQMGLLGQPASTQKPTIRCSAPELGRMVDEALHALANYQSADGRQHTVYQRGGQLVTINEREAEETKKFRTERTLTISRVSEGYLKECLCEAATWERWEAKKGRKAKSDNDDAGKWVKTTPPLDVIKSLMGGRPHWGPIRPLKGIVTAPCLISEDGEILQKPGYDRQSGLYFHQTCVTPLIKERPTVDDVKKAVSEIEDIISDFPFAGDAYKSMWFALLLTALSRNAIHGPVPLFLHEAHTQAEGKTLLADLVSIIATGKSSSQMSWTYNDDEFRKRVLSIGIAGQQVIVLDNVKGKLGGPTLENILTNNGEFSDRLLGSSVTVSVKLNMTWIATGNNAQLSTDMLRRTALIKLHSGVERPEERTGFRYPNLIEVVHKRRGELIHAALTILKGYLAAGSPAVKMTPWGSFGKWTETVVRPLIWAGMIDPGATKIELQDKNTQGDALLGLLTVLHSIGKTKEYARGITAKQLSKVVNGMQPPLGQHRDDLKDVLERLGVKDVNSAHQIGKALQSVKGICKTVADENNEILLKVDSQKNRAGTQVWSATPGGIM